MKLASLKGGRDGRLIVVSRDLTRAVAVPLIAPTLQAALDEWEEIGPRLQAVADELEQPVGANSRTPGVGGEGYPPSSSSRSGDRSHKEEESRSGDRSYKESPKESHKESDTFPFDESSCAAPLPRAYQWADGSAYVNHVELVRRARGAQMPERFWHEPLMYQGGSDDFIGGRDDVPLGSEDWGIDFEGEVAVITGDVPMGTPAAQALRYVRLVVLVNDVSLRGLIPGELEKGFGFYQSKPATSFSPVAAGRAG